MKFFDAHSHINFNAFRDDADEVIKRALAKEIGMLAVGTQYSTSRRAVEYAQKYPGQIWAVVGLHPIHLQEGIVDYQDKAELATVEIVTHGEIFDREKYLALAQEPVTVAIGEIGLDYHHFAEGDEVEKIKAKQKEVFEKLIDLANEVRKPVIIHCWDAYKELLEILQRHPVQAGGVIHSFVGSYKTARKFIALGYKISVNGIITYSDSYDRLIKEIDLADLLIETDCPYLAPGVHKGERNEPAFVEDVAERIAVLKGVTITEVKAVTLANTKKLFKIT